MAVQEKREECRTTSARPRNVDNAHQDLRLLVLGVQGREEAKAMGTKILAKYQSVALTSIKRKSLGGTLTRIAPARCESIELGVTVR